MTEVKKEVDPGKGVEIPGETQEQSLSPRDAQDIAVKEKAKSLGWKPRTEYDKDPADWVSAREFLARQSFFDKIKTQSNEIRNLRDDIKAMTQHFSQMKEVEYKRALSELKSERKDAIASGDSAKAESVSDQITEIETARTVAKTVPQAQANYGAAEFESFKQRNGWYNTDADLTKKANAVGIGYAQMNPNASPSQVLEYVEEAMRPSIQPKKTIAPASPDAGGVRVGAKGKGGKLTEADLTPMQVRMMNTFVQRGVLTKEKYLESLTVAEGNR